MNTNNTSHKIYVSYAWGVEEQNKIVEKLGKACKDRGLTLLLDKNELHYKDSIRNYMDELASGDAIVLVLSKDYFESAYCMYEICQAHSLKDFQKRIFPIVVSNTRFYKTKERTPFIRYWQKETEELKNDLKSVDIENMGSSSHDEVKEYGEYSRLIDDLLSILGDMNTLTEDIHVNSDFEKLLDSIEQTQQQDGVDKSISKLKHHRQSDQQFRKKIVENIRNILKKQTNLSEALEAIISEDNIELKNLADFLCAQEFEIAIDDNLYTATKQCLSVLEKGSFSYIKTWETAKDILGWLSLLVVRNEWVEDSQKLIKIDDLSFIVQVSTTTGIEVVSARLRQFQPKLKASSGRAEPFGEGAILPPELNAGWGDGFSIEQILIEIWNKVFPEEVLHPKNDRLSAKKLNMLKRTLETREKHKTHHYYIPIPENEIIAKKVLEKLPSITIVYLSSSDTGSTLIIKDETSFTTVIREFLTMNHN